MSIVRTWSATATADGAGAYHRYFAGTLLPQLRDLPGFAGAYLLSRDTDGVVELTTHTMWASLDAVRAFTRTETGTGSESADDLTASVVEPEAQAMLLDFDRTVVHREVLVTAG